MQILFTAKQFDTDLTLRKSAIKLMIRKELTRLANEADDDDEEKDADADDNAGKDEMVVNGTKVKAWGVASLTGKISGQLLSSFCSKPQSTPAAPCATFGLLILSQVPEMCWEN